MVLCTLALIEGGTGPSSPKEGRHGTYRGAPKGCECSIGAMNLSGNKESPIRKEMTVPLTLAMAGV